MLEEFSDSMKALNWENVFAKPISFKKKVEDIVEIYDAKVVDNVENDREIKENINDDNNADIEDEERENEGDIGSEESEDEDDEREIVEDSDSECLDSGYEVVTTSDQHVMEPSVNPEENLVNPIVSQISDTANPEELQIEDCAILNMTNS